MFDLLKKKISGVVNSFINKKVDGTALEQEADGKSPAQHHDKDVPGSAHESPVDSKAMDYSAYEGQNAAPETKLPESVMQQPAMQEDNATNRTASNNQNSKTSSKSNIKLSIATKIKGTILKNVSLNDSEIDDLTQNIEMSMLQSDVAQKTAEKFSESLKLRLKSDKFDYKNIRKEIDADVRTALLDVLESAGKSPNVLGLIRKNKEFGLPSKILFIGPNGTGKTTTIAKVAHLLKHSGLSVVISASDTFRAAAIEQTEHHGKSVGVPVIKSGYGADPASVAYDTIEYARAHRIDAVLIDTAGRQETNRNLVMEIQKMVRVSKPDITIFVGESTAGNAISRQISELQKSIKIDAIILTKLDCDAKGGNAISIADITGVPIAFFCNGESYDSIMEYNPDIILDAIAPAS